MGRSKGNILNKLHIFKTNFYIFVLEILYRAHIHIRYLHDKVYQRGGTYKKYSDSPVSSYVHRASMLAFVFSFVVFQFMQNIWPYMFTFKPRQVEAGQSTTTWDSQNEFELNSNTGEGMSNDGSTTHPNLAWNGTNSGLELTSGGTGWSTAATTTTSTVQATRNTSQKKMVKASDGKYAWFYGDGSSLVYRTSMGTYAGWSSPSSAIVSGNISDFSVAIDSADTIHLAYNLGVSLYYKRLTYSGGSWSEASSSTVAARAGTGGGTCDYNNSGYYNYNYNSPTVVTNGNRIFIGYTEHVTGEYYGDYGCEPDNSDNVYVAWSPDLNGASWTPKWLYSYSSGMQSAVVTYGTRIAVIFNSGYIKWISSEAATVTTSSWSAVGNINNTILTSDVSAIGEGSNIHVLVRNSGIKYIKYNGTSWDASYTDVTAGANDTDPSLFYDGTNVYAYYAKYVASNSYNIAYRTNANWASEAAITTDNQNNRYPSTPVSDTSTKPVFWSNGTANPYNLKYTRYGPVYNTPGTLGDTGNGLRVDSGTASVSKWAQLKFVGTIQEGTTVKFQIRPAASFGGGGAAGFINPDSNGGSGTGTGWSASPTAGIYTDETPYTINIDTDASSSQTLEIKIEATSTGETPTIQKVMVVYDTLENPPLGQMSISTASNGTISTSGTEGVWTKDTTANFNVPTASLTCTNCGTSTNRRAEVEYKLTSAAFAGTGTVIDGGAGDADASVNGAVQISGLAVGSYHWRARAVDNEGRVSGWTSYGTGSDTPTAAADFSIDQSSPTGTVSIDGGTYTADSTPDLTLSASDTGGSGLSQMRFSNDGSSWSDWETYATTKANWALSAGDGSKTVYAQFKDNAGNLSSQWIQTSDADFNDGTKTDVVASNNGLQIGPYSDAYSANYIDGIAGTPLEGKQVYNIDSTEMRWKTSNTSCVGPQCATGLDPSYPSNYALVADNNVDFSAYSSRNFCVSVGGRLPTMQELSSIYTNKASYGNNFHTNNLHWSSTEYNATKAWSLYFGSGVAYSQYTKADVGFYARCVREAPTSVYIASGNIVSSVKDNGTTSVNYNNIAWNETIPSGTSMTIEVRAGNNADVSDGSWASVTNGQSLDNSTYNGKQYIQYKATLNSNAAQDQTPRLEDITINSVYTDSIILDTTAPIVPRDNVSDPTSFPANNTLRAPNGGESWGGGTLKTIVWNKDNISDGTGSGLSATPVNLYYSGTGTQPWASIASGLINGANSANGGCTPDAGTGCYAWRLPNTIDSTNMKVKVEFVDTVGNKVDYNNDATSNADTSDNVFSSTSDSTPPTAFTISGSSPDNNDWTDATPDISWSASSDPESGPVTYELWMTQTATPTYPTDFAKRTDVGSAGDVSVTNATPTLTGLEGAWYYFIRAKNGAYDAGDPLTYRDIGYGIGGDTAHYFRVDDTKPTGTVTAKVTLSFETDATSSYIVDLDLTQSDGAGSGTNMVQFSNDNVFYCNFASYVTPKANFDLRDDCAGGTTLTSRGTRTVYMKLKDAAGNTSNVITDTIIYDVTNPNIPASVASSIQGTVVSGNTNTVRVAWTDIADPPEATETVSGIDGYNIYRNDSFNATYTKVNGNLVAPGTQLYDDATATDGVTYNYKVKAVDNAGNTNTNNTATSQSLSDKTAPSAVSSFTAGGANDTTIGLAWNSTSDNAAANGGKANKYYIQRTGALGGTEPVLSGDDPSFTYSALVTVNFEEAGKYDSGTDRYSYTDTVQAQQWYYYKIKAEDSATPTPYQSTSWIYFKSRGNFAPSFNLSDISVTANNGHTKDTAAPGDIMNFSFPVTDADGAGDLNAGTGNALETIRIVDALSGESLAATQVTSKIQNVANGYTFSYNYTVPSASPYGTYTATLRVKDSVAVDGSTHDISRNINFKVIPEKPTSVSVSGTNSTTLTVSWTAPGNAGNRTGLRATNTYSVRRADTSGGTYAHIGYTTSVSYADNGLTMNEDYYYKVVAFDVSNNEGVLSDISGTSGTTTPTPAVPQASSVKMIDASTVDEGQNRFLLVWGDPMADGANNTTAANFANYVVEKAENCANNVGSCIFSNAGETANKYFVDVSLSNTTDYTYRIRVKDSFANLSRNDISPVKEGKPGAKPSVSIVSESTGVSTAKIKWTATQEAETQVVYSTNQSQLNDANAKVNIAGIGGRRLAGEEHDVNLVGLTPNTTYYYKIVSRNQLGFANDVAVRTIKTQDFTIQNISNVTTTTTATVHWTTNIDADSNVEYKKEARIGESAEESKTAGDPKLTKDHEVVIKALRPDTSYTYKIRSVTSDKYISETQFLTFKTKPYDASQFTITPNASSIAEQNITATSAKIVWNTAVATTSWLDYGTSSGSYNQSAGNDNFNTVHVVELLNLTPGTTYFYKVRGKDTNEIEYTSKEYSFTAVLLPQILNPKTSGLTSYTIDMDWETNVSATSFVAYGKDTAYGSGVGKTVPSKVHSVKLENLEDNTTYHYQITVKDQFGNEAKSADLTFATPIDTTGPEVKEVKTDILPMGTDDETASAIISWTTSKPATTQIDYDEGVIGGKYSKHSVEDKNLNGAHTVIIKDLNPSTTYHFRIVSKDKRGNTGNSQDYNFVTPTKEKSVLQLIIRSLEETFSWVSQMPKYFRGVGQKIIGR